jgi:protein-S-isoprenylcysteine O-methyltransferase Ste14
MAKEAAAMHIAAGALLILEFILLWLLEKVVFLRFLDVLGGVVWVFAMPLLFLPMAALRKRGGVQEGMSYTETRQLVTTGLYGIVRHPQYLGWSLMYLVPFLFNPRWEIALSGVVGIFCVQVFTRQEERQLREKFGAAYGAYAKAVPRMDFLCGCARRLRRDGGR